MMTLVMMTLWSRSDIFCVIGNEGQIGTYKPPSRNTNTIDAFRLRERCSLRTICTGNARITESMSTSTAPVVIQNMLKSKQYCSQERPIQLYSRDRQLSSVASVVPSQKAPTTARTSSDMRRKVSSTEKMRR